MKAPTLPLPDSPLPYRLLSKQEVAALLGYTTRTIDRLIETRQIPFTLLPTGAGACRRKVRFNSLELDAWIRGGAVAPETVAGSVDDAPETVAASVNFAGSIDYAESVDIAKGA